MGNGHYSVLRVSHLSQIDNFSIEQQKESIETYARFHSIEITEHLADGATGAPAAAYSRLGCDAGMADLGRDDATDRCG